MDYETVYAYEAGQEAMKKALVESFAQWAVAHPDRVVSDELWSFVGMAQKVTVK